MSTMLQPQHVTRNAAPRCFSCRRAVANVEPGLRWTCSNSARSSPLHNLTRLCTGHSAHACVYTQIIEAVSIAAQARQRGIKALQRRATLSKHAPVRGPGRWHAVVQSASMEQQDQEGCSTWPPRVRHAADGRGRQGGAKRLRLDRGTKTARPCAKLPPCGRNSYSVPGHSVVRRKLSLSLSQRSLLELICRVLQPQSAPPQP